MFKFPRQKKPIVVEKHVNILPDIFQPLTAEMPCPSSPYRSHDLYLFQQGFFSDVIFPAVKMNWLDIDALHKKEEEWGASIIAAHVKPGDKTVSNETFDAMAQMYADVTAYGQNLSPVAFKMMIDNHLELYPEHFIYEGGRTEPYLLRRMSYSAIHHCGVKDYKEAVELCDRMKEYRQQFPGLYSMCGDPQDVKIDNGIAFYKAYKLDLLHTVAVTQGATNYINGLDQ